jgi:hypothetical protein
MNESMKTFELTLVGFDLDNEALTGHLLLWIKCPNRLVLDRYVDRLGIELQEPPRYLEGRDEQISPEECDGVWPDLWGTDSLLTSLVTTEKAHAILRDCL